MKKLWISVLAVIFILSINCQAATPTALEIIEKMDTLMRGKTSYWEMTIMVQTTRWERTIKLLSWAQGIEKSFMKITYPIKDKGITFLKINNDMWQYIPKIEKIIKFPPSMMLQSWMGTDFSNDDLVKESSTVNDYTHMLLSGDERSYQIESLPKEDAAVVWGKIVSWVDKIHYYPIKQEYYDEDNELIRRLIYTEVIKTGDRYLPTVWTMEPMDEDKIGNKTILKLDKIEFDVPLDDSLFSLRSLKTLSK
jgi:outer membrane lipoprotein-sorting protein